MKAVVQGANAPVLGDQLAVRVSWTVAGGRAVEADASAYLLAGDGKVRGDEDMVFYNQPQGGGGGVRFSAGGGQGCFALDLARLPAAIERIAFCLTIHDGQARGQTLALLHGVSIMVEGTGEALVFHPELADANETAMVIGELYRRQGQWKFRAVGQGFAGGLAPLARSFGIDVAEAPPPPIAAPPPATPHAPVRLSKVTLDKPGQTVSLEKRGIGFGEILVNLNWSRAKRGFFGSGAIDLDLGCLYELANGRKGAVQALGRAFGTLDAAPFIALSGDDRTGDDAAGETLRINGMQWADIRRIVLFANIYDGAPNWRQTDGIVTVAMPDQPTIEVRMTEGRDTMRLCGVVLLENDGGRIKATRIVEYFGDQEDLDRRFGWGIRWTAGTKD